MLLNQLVIESIVVGSKNYCIIARDVFSAEWFAAQVEVMFTHFREYRYVRVAIPYDASLGFNQLHNFN
ncbi:hypothetical protein D3C76_1762330 [compost metagenome]